MEQAAEAKLADLRLARHQLVIGRQIELKWKVLSAEIQHGAKQQAVNHPAKTRDCR